MSLFDTLLSGAIIFIFFLVIYAGARKKTLKEAWDEIRSFFESRGNKGEEISAGIGEVKRKW